MFDSFDRVRIINLHERKDRRRTMMRQLSAVGGRGQFFPATRPIDSGLFTSRGMHGSFLSHLGVISEAASADESVLILEDDCNFFPEARDYPVPECDIFYGSHSEDADMMIGAHCMGFSAKAVGLLNAYLLEYLRPEFTPDAKAAQEEGFNPGVRPPIDGAYVWFRRRHPELVTKFALLTYQRRSRSDCTPANFYDRIPVIKDIAEAFRRAIN